VRYKELFTTDTDTSVKEKYCFKQVIWRYTVQILL